MKNFFINHDTFDFCLSRTIDGRGGFVGDRLNCHGGFGGLENAQTTETENVQNNQVTTQGGSGAGSITVGIGGEHNTGSLTVNNQNVDAGVISSVTDSLATLASLGQSESNQATQYAEENTNTLSQDLATIATNAAPQSQAASQEILAGTSPSGAESGGNGFLSGFDFSDNFVNLAVVAGTVLSAWVFLRSRGRSS